MNVDTLHTLLRSKVQQEVGRIALLLKSVPQDELNLAAQYWYDVEEHPTNPREEWFLRLRFLQHLLQHVPRDEFILAHTLSPESNAVVQMRVEVLGKLVAEAENAEHFMAICRECVRDIGSPPAEHSENEQGDRDSARQTTEPPSDSREARIAKFKAMLAEASCRVTGEETETRGAAD